MTANERAGKAILPEPRSVQKANEPRSVQKAISYQDDGETPGGVSSGIGEAASLLGGYLVQPKVSS